LPIKPGKVGNQHSDHLSPEVNEPEGPPIVVALTKIWHPHIAMAVRCRAVDRDAAHSSDSSY
jgi:hypothetical protein